MPAPDAKKTLAKGASLHCEIVVNFDDVRKTGMFVSTRPGKAHYEMLISNLGCDGDYRPRGYFAQIEDVTHRRTIEADLRKLQTMDAGKSVQEGITGSLEEVGLTDVVQILCSGGRSMEIDLNNGKDKAQIFIRTGNIIHCAVGALQARKLSTT